MKYEITRACGHVETVELYGKVADRESKINWYGKTMCRDCYNTKNGEKDVEMSYSEYKNKYANCKTKSGSYDKKTKTIVVFVPQPTEDQKEPEICENEVIQQMADESGYTKDVIKRMIASGSKKAEEALQVYGKKAKTMPDKSGKFCTAYDAMAYAAELLKKYGY